MTSVEYGRHARRVVEWDDVVAELNEPEPRVPVDLTHGSVFLVEEDSSHVPAPSLRASVARLFGWR